MRPAKWCDSPGRGLAPNERPQTCSISSQVFTARAQHRLPKQSGRSRVADSTVCPAPKINTGPGVCIDEADRSISVGGSVNISRPVHSALGVEVQNPLHGFIVGSDALACRVRGGGLLQNPG